MPDPDPFKSSERVRVAKNEWIVAEIKGNALVPQVFSGISTSMLACLAEDEFRELHDFHMSQLSQEQIDQLRRAMDQMHVEYKIQVVSREFAPERARLPGGGDIREMMKLDNSRFKDFWIQVKDHAIDELDHFLWRVLNGNNVPRPEERSVAEKLEYIDFNFEGEEGSRLRELAVRYFTALLEVMETPQGREAAARRREKYRYQGVHYDEKTAKALRQEFEEYRAAIGSLFQRMHPDLAVHFDP